MTLDTFAPRLYDRRTVLVSGGTSRIGLSCARAFRDLGAEVVATGATRSERDQASDDAENTGLVFEVLDVRNGPAIVDLLERMEHLHVLVNAAGVIRRDIEHDPDVFADVVDINLNGAMRVCSAAKAKLRDSRGAVVNVASMLSFFGGARVPAYSASKGGISQLTRSLAAAWASDGIRVNAVAPGWIATPLTKDLQADPERNRAILARTPMNRWGLPNEVASCVVFLGSPAACFVTGAILAVDGGYLTV